MYEVELIEGKGLGIVPTKFIKEECWSWKGVSFREFSLCRLKKSLQIWLKYVIQGFIELPTKSNQHQLQRYLSLLLKYGFCNEPLTSWILFSSLFFQISTDLEKKWEPKSSTGQRFICTEVTSYKIHILVSLESFCNLQPITGQNCRQDYWAVLWLVAGTRSLLL